MALQIKCDRCQVTQDLPAQEGGLAAITRSAQAIQILSAWSQVEVSRNVTGGKRYSLCEKCRRELVLFMNGNPTERATIEADRTIRVQHGVQPDCHLVWDPDANHKKGAFICGHDDPNRFALLAGNDAASNTAANDLAQDVAEGIPLACEPERKPGRECTCAHARASHLSFGCRRKGCDCSWTNTDREPEPEHSPGELADESNKPARCRCGHDLHERGNCGQTVKTKKPGNFMSCPCNLGGVT